MKTRPSALLEDKFWGAEITGEANLVFLDGAGFGESLGVGVLAVSFSGVREDRISWWCNKNQQVYVCWTHWNRHGYINDTGKWIMPKSSHCQPTWWLPKRNYTKACMQNRCRLWVGMLCPSSKSIGVNSFNINWEWFILCMGSYIFVH